MPGGSFPPGIKRKEVHTILFWTIRLIVALLVIGFIIYHFMDRFYKKYCVATNDSNDSDEDDSIDAGDVDIDDLGDEDIISMLNNAAKFLGIPQTKIEIVPFLAKSIDGQLLNIDDETVYLRMLSSGSVLPLGGHFMPNEIAVIKGIGTVYLSRHIGGQRNSTTTMLFLGLHELRHVWQFDNQKETYYRHNASNETESMNDISEIDADAFAEAYLENEYSLSAESDKNVFHYFDVDGGKRWQRKAELEKEYFLTL